MLIFLITTKEYLVILLRMWNGGIFFHFLRGKFVGNHDRYFFYENSSFIFGLIYKASF